MVRKGGVLVGRKRDTGSTHSGSSRSATQKYVILSPRRTDCMAVSNWLGAKKSSSED